ncbi:DNA-binding XRE family transcriptional regulator [Paenibacillus methanolicus]|uniref:DNA-binding XRE family transcriptional regulator n=1 Tax=Paenibacillus methanolicus TaxID=582686 RepID=A0A5S5BTH1_9BACL|nr:DNA-binding XRE family transcriptional regulator [Paenibacillus methanolicus]
MSKRKADPRIIQKRTRFRELRLAKDKSQRAMSLDFDCSESWIRSIEHGRCNPELKFAFRLAEYLGSTVDDVFQDLKDCPFF